VLFPGLVLVGLGVWAFIALLDADKVALAVGGTLAVSGGFLLYYAYKHIKLALEERPSDVVLDASGLRIEGGSQHGLALAWPEIDAQRCRVESTTDDRIVLWRVIVNLPLLAISIVGESDLTMNFTDKTPIKRLWVARRGSKEVLVAEGELPTEIESLDTLMNTIQSPHWYGEQKTAPTGPEAIVCRNCGATVAPVAEQSVACKFCSTRVEIPEDVRQRVAAAAQLASTRQAGFSRLTRLLESQPSATRAGIAILVAAIPIALAWPVAAFFIVRDWEMSGAGGVRFLQLITFPLLLTFGAFLLARGRLTDRFALHAVVTGFGARDPARPGEPYRCRACEAALPLATGSPIVRCIYCNQASVIGLDLRAEARSAKDERRSLEKALSKRTQERWLWTGGSLLSLVLLALAVVALRGTFSMHRKPKSIAAIPRASVTAPMRTTTTTATMTATTSPEPMRLGAMTRHALVTSTHGTPPFSEKTCALVVIPLGPGSCRAFLRCGEKTVYGSPSNHIDCGATSTDVVSLADSDPTYIDRDPIFQVDFVKGTATLADATPASKTYSVEFRLTQ
jgi:DNA-directed RNA polymerase subunit RPC12/RpoP